MIPTRERPLGTDLLLGVLAIFIALGIACRGGPGITVSAAASLGDAMDEIGREFERRESVNVDLNLGGSSALARQVELGAPVDAVFFAGQEPMDRLVAAGFVAPGESSVVLENRLVVVAKRGQKADLRTLADLLSRHSGRISMADPALAPAGVYADAALVAAGITSAQRRRVIPALDVRAAAAAVASGSAEFGIVYATDALALDGVSAVLEVPARLHPPIIYPAAVISGRNSMEAARRFVEFLNGDFAGAVFRSHGFIIPSGR